MGPEQAIYAGCSGAFVLLIALTLLRARVSSIGAAIAGASLLTAIWSAGSAFPRLLPVAAAPVLDSLRLSAWLIVMVAVVGLSAERGERASKLPFLLAMAFCIVVVGWESAILMADGTTSDYARRVHDFLRVGLGVGGLLATENVLRNADGEQRRNLWPFCLALGVTFAFELFLYADRLMAPGAAPIIDGRPLVGIAAVPLLALAMARNRDWRVDIHVSRSFVLHTAALIASGLFFLALASAGVLIRQHGGTWGPSLQLLTLVGAAIVLASAFGSRDIRIGLKQLITQHFFSHRFDYRQEWLRFAATVSRPQPGTEDRLGARVVRALAQIVDSPSGMLWCLREGSEYVFEAGWNQASKAGRKVQANAPFLAGFRGGDWIQVRSEDPQLNWPADAARPWLAVPLSHNNEMIAFVVLSASSQFYFLDRETFDLLRAAATQAASYLAEEQSTRTLLDAQILNEYSRRFAFVVHDIKNMASQLGLIIGNARRHIEDPAFRQDMLMTLEDSVARMKRLISQLQAAKAPTAPEIIEPDVIIANLTQELAAVGTRVLTQLEATSCWIAINGDSFRSTLFHLINNAREAAHAETSVFVASRRLGDRITIDIVDDGPGMDAEFIRDELFRPFRSTKSDGLGIGVYQTRETLRNSGGELEVISEKGVGTTMRVTLPLHQPVSLASASV